MGSAPCVEVTLHSARILPGSIIVESIHARAFGVTKFILPMLPGSMGSMNFVIYYAKGLPCDIGIGILILEYKYWNAIIGILILGY